MKRTDQSNTRKPLTNNTKNTNMNNTAKLRSTSSMFPENTISIVSSTQNALSFRRISHRKPPPTTPSNDQSYVIVKSDVNDRSNELLTRSIIIDSAARQRGFLPYDYRIANTFETIHRHRAHYRASSKLPSTTTAPKNMNRSPTRLDAFGNLTSSMSKLAEQRLVLRDKSGRKKHNTTPSADRLDKSFLVMSDADFATDIPNALQLICQNTQRKSTTERHLLETLTRERLHQSRYRLLPVNRAPYA